MSSRKNTSKQKASAQAQAPKRKERVATFKLKGENYHAVNKRAHKLARLAGKRSVMTKKEILKAVKERNSEYMHITPLVYVPVGKDEYAKSKVIR